MQEASVALFVNEMIDEVGLQATLELTKRILVSRTGNTTGLRIHWMICPSETKAEFRLATSELPRLAETLGIPEMFTCCNGTTASGLEGLCILLKRFAHPYRLSDLIPRLGDQCLSSASFYRK